MATFVLKIFNIIAGFLGKEQVDMDAYAAVTGNADTSSFTLLGETFEWGDFGIGVTLLAIFIAICAFNAFFGVIINMRLFYKAYMPMWAAFVPFYNLYCLSKMAFNKGWMFFLFLIPGVGFLFTLAFNWRLSETFGHGFGYFLGLTLLPVPFRAILAFDRSLYMGPI